MTAPPNWIAEMEKRSRLSGKSRIKARANTAMSRAEVHCRGSGRPFGLYQRLSCMPIRWAASFIIEAKPSTLPPRLSPMAKATSLADFTMMILRALPRVSCVPGLKPIFEGGSAAAAGEIVISVSIDARPWRTRSRAT